MQALEALTEINLDDLVSSFGWQAQPLPSWLLRCIFHAPARKFAKMMLEFDAVTGAESLPEGARHILKYFAECVEVFGLENVPVSGPVLFLSNHPGIIDTLALFAGINRPDLRIIALNRPFLLSLPNTARHLFFVSDDSNARIRAVKQAANHLREGGALLTFPAGHIEPDPDVYQGALESLEDWADSAGVFIRLAPETKIVPALVRAVLWERAVKFPLTNLKKTRDEREKLGAAFQLLAHILFNVHPLKVKIQFARPITLAEIGSKELAAAHSKIMERMRGLVQNPPQQSS